nr:DUF6268 family outer membrane beta-barrel protein [Allomuricauda sp.]|tara:strand:+ start:51039 stop:51917 length:879 start_codon:yes stop_codon:yes gene_type:complete
MMQNRLVPVLFCCILFGVLGRAQSTDLLRIDYLRIPENNSGIGTSRYKVLLNVPIKLGNDDYFVIGGEYNRFEIDFSRPQPFDAEQIDVLHVMDMNLGYITRWNDNWRLITIATPRLASNLLDGVVTKDFFINATATLWKERMDAEIPFRLVLGLSYNSTTGLPFPLPLISYYRRFHPKWSYTLGIPRSNFKYHITDRHTLQLALLLDGYFINLQDDILLPDGRIGTRISLSTLVGAVGYQFNLSKMMSFYTLLGGSIEQEGKLRDNKRVDVFLLNREANLYLRGGFKISIF